MNLRAPFVMAGLAAALAGQELLRVDAASPRWLAAFAQALDLDVPPLSAGERFELRFATGGVPALTRTPAPPGAPALAVEVHAARWLALEPDTVTRTRRQLTNRAIGLAQVAGVSRDAASDLVGGVFAMLHQVETVRATAVPVGADGAYDVRFELRPTAGSALARWIAATRLAPAPAPALPWRHALVQLRIALPAAHLGTVVGPFLPLAAALARRPAADLAAELPLLDGTFGLALSPTNLGLAFGLGNPEAFAARATDADRLRRDAAALADAGIVAEFTPDALRHRGITALRSRVQGPRAVPGLADDDGALVAYGARVGALWLQIGGRDAREVTKGAIEAALDGRLRPPSGAPADATSPWLELELDLTRLARVLTSSDDLTPGDARSRRLSLSLSSPDLLLATVQLR